jgi:hypothetical protein
MSGSMAAGESSSVRPGWETIAAARPQLAATAGRYLDQIGVSLRPNTVIKTDQVLAGFCHHLLANHPDVACWAHVQRVHIESFKLVLAARRTANGPLKANTVRAHLSLLKVFLDRTASGDGTTPRPGPGCSAPTCHRSPSRYPKRSMTPLPPGSWPRRATRPTRSPRCAWRCWPARPCGSVSCATCPLMRCHAGPGRGGCESRSASSATTATSRCTPAWSNSSTPGNSTIIIPPG